MNTMLPGDWTMRGAIIVAMSEDYTPNATRIDTLRTIAGMLRSGMTLTALDHTDPMRVLNAKWTHVRGEAMGFDRATNRAIARKALASFTF